MGRPSKSIWTKKSFVDTSGMEPEQVIEKKQKVMNFKKEELENYFNERHPLPYWEDTILQFWMGWRKPVTEEEKRLHREIVRARNEGKILQFEGEALQ